MKTLSGVSHVVRESTKHMLLHTSPTEICLNSSFTYPNGYLFHGFWFSFGYEWIDLYGRDNYIYGVNIKNASFCTISETFSDMKSKILLLDTKEDIEQVEKLYHDERDGIDYNKIEKTYGGIAMINFEESKSNYGWYNGLDVSSGCIWNFSIIEKLTLIDYTKDGFHCQTKPKCFI